jgi:hypothetical protein
VKYTLHELNKIGFGYLMANFRASPPPPSAADNPLVAIRNLSLASAYKRSIQPSIRVKNEYIKYRGVVKRWENIRALST